MGINTKTIQYSEILKELLNSLDKREKEVLVKRFALESEDKSTLEEIGNLYNITRERVRQIESEAIKRVKNASNEAVTKIDEVTSLINNVMKQYGGFIGKSHLMDELLHTQDVQEGKSLEFLLDNVISDKYEKVNGNKVDSIWTVDKEHGQKIVSLVDSIIDLLEKHGKPMNFEDIVGTCKTCSFFPQIDGIQGENHFIIEGLLKTRSDIKQNILGQWGKKDWASITPKRMTDKAYLIMTRENKPLHFEECADLINKAQFDKKKACAATVHNELILDDKYVLVGRGIYALKDWGYQAGTVSDIIQGILKEKGPMDKKTLTEEVLKQRMVQKTTITLSLMNKDKFKRLEDGRYALVK